MELAEELKLRLDLSNSDGLNGQAPQQTDHEAPNRDNIPDDAESQMRKALGLMGEASRSRAEPERAETPHRLGLGDRFGGGGGLHRRRFVQDGDVPVTVVRRDPGHDSLRGAAPQGPLPTSSRLQRTEAALAAETAAREKAERALADAQSLARDLQTKIGHAELARSEAVEALRRERDAAVEARSGQEEWEAKLRGLEERVEHAEDEAQSLVDQLEEERRARKAAEKALRAVEAAGDAAAMKVRALTQELAAATKASAPAKRAPAAPVASTPVASKPVVAKEVAATPVVRPAAPVARKGRTAEPVVAMASPAVRRHKLEHQDAADPEPVKWWLSTKAAPAKRK